MKTNFPGRGILLLFSASITLLAGCLDDASSGQSPDKKDSATGSTLTNQVSAPKTNAATKGEAPSKTDLEVGMLNLPPELTEIVKMKQSGLGDDLIMAYIARTPYAYKLSADDIVYLNDLGIAPRVTTAMLRKELKVAPGTPQTVETTPRTTTIENDVAAASAAASNALTMAESPTTTETVSIAAPGITAPPPPQPVESAPPPPPQGVPSPYVSAQPPQEVAMDNGAPPMPASPEVVNNNSYNYFYNDLAPYGRWMTTPDYGYCWQPSVMVVQSGWRPYCDGGRWIYSDCGWYWQSDYSWGWAPFHYGRWHEHPRHGWVWTPDRIWGPAWVSWRVGSDHCGWAPLPPAAHFRSGVGFSYMGRGVGFNLEFGLSVNSYMFLPWGHFNHENPRHFLIARDHVSHIYGRSRVMNEYAHSPSHGGVIQRGFGPEHVARFTHQEIRPVSVRSYSGDRSHSPQPDRIVKTGNSEVIYRSDLPAHPARGGTEPQRRTGVVSPSGGASAPAFTKTAPTPPAPTAPTGVAPRSFAPPSPVDNRPNPVQNGTVARSGGNPAQPNAGIRDEGRGAFAPARSAAPVPTRPPSTVGNGSAVRELNRSIQGAPTVQPRPGNPAVASQPSVPTPPIVNRPQQYSPPTPATTAPAQPRFEARRNENSSSAPTYSAPAARTPTANVPSPTRAFGTRMESSPTYTPPARTFSTPAPTYSAPTPSYTPPVRSEPRRVESYSAPARSAPSFTPPPSYSAPSAPAPSVERRSEPTRSSPSTPSNNSGDKSERRR